MKINNTEYKETIDKSLKYTVVYPEDEISTTCYPGWSKTNIKRQNYKILVIDPCLSVKTSVDSPISKVLNNKIELMNDDHSLRKCDCIFDVEENDITYRNCLVTNCFTNNNDVIYEFQPDYWEGTITDIHRYCGRYQIPMNLNDNYLEYIDNHNCYSVL